MTSEISLGFMPQTERDLGFTLPYVRGDLRQSVMPPEPQNPAGGKEALVGLVLTSVGIGFTLHGVIKVLTARRFSDAVIGTGFIMFGLWCFSEGRKKLSKKFPKEFANPIV